MPCPFYTTQDGKVIPGTKKLFHTLTHAFWTDKLRLPPPPIPSWDKKTPLDDDLEPHLKPLYQKSLKARPRLLLQPSYQGGYSMESLDAIERGQIIEEYLGEYVPNQTTNSSYRFGPIDAKHYRNTMAMIEDGFPNVQPFYLFDGNAPVKILFISTERIEPSSTLLINYGLSHSVKTGKHFEYGFAKMCAFFQEHPLSFCFKRLWFLNSQKRSTLSWDEHLELENLAAKLQYLYQTPSAILLLLLSKVTSSHELFSYFHNTHYQFYLLGYSPTPKTRQIEVSTQITLLMQYFKISNRPDDLALDLSNKVRIRLLISFFIKHYLTSLDPLLYYHETLLLNEADRAIQLSDKDLFLSIFAKSKQKDLFLEEAIFYAKEAGSSLYDWLRNQTPPATPPSNPIFRLSA